MLFYATIFIICVALAGGIVWFYRTSGDASKAIYDTIIPLSKIEHAKPAAEKKAGTDTPEPWGRKSHQTPGNLARAHAAMPAAQTPWGWAGSEKQVGGKRTRNRPHKSKTDHCSLYEDNKSKPKSIRSQNVGWPYREEKTESFGRSYKVTRKTPRLNKTPRLKKTDLKSVDKPWGW